MSFNELTFAERLDGPDRFSRAPAESLTEAFDQAIQDSVATKADALGLETALRGDRPAADNVQAPKDMRLLPSKLAPGIEPSDDPLIDARVRAYVISLGRRA